MNQTEQKWLENRVRAAVEDDYYLDREEEKRIKEEAAAKNISVKDIELVIRTELNTIGAVCERILLDELENLLRQFTDNDKRLDGKEERDALNKVLQPANGKKKGLDPRIASDYVTSFCRVNGVRRDSEIKQTLVVPIISVAVIIAAFIIWNIFTDSKTADTNISQNNQYPNSNVILNDIDRAEIDDQLRRAKKFVEMAQYTDPPEKSAKACLDQIRRIDPSEQYKANEIKQIVEQIVDHYIALADKSYLKNDIESVARWLERAKLMGASSELIREKERLYGLLKQEQ